MSCCGLIENFCIAVVSIQLIFGVARFLYEQFLGPFLNGKSINFRKYGEWARKSEIQILSVNFWVTFISLSVASEIKLKFELEIFWPDQRFLWKLKADYTILMHIGRGGTLLFLSHFYLKQKLNFPKWG